MTTRSVKAAEAAEAEMTITLQDLQVLNEKARRARKHLESIGRADGDYHTEEHDNAADASWNAKREFEVALVNFYRSGALQRLAELAEDGERYRWLRSNALDDAGDGTLTITCELNIEGNQPAEIDAAIDTARAPSVKEQKRG
jgi:hypothetical protein